MSAWEALVVLAQYDTPEAIVWLNELGSEVLGRAIISMRSTDSLIPMPA